MALRHEYAVTIEWMLITATPPQEPPPGVRIAVMPVARERATCGIDDERACRTQRLGNDRHEDA